MSYISDLTEIRDNLVATLKAVTLAHTTNPQPSYSVGGRNVDWTGYQLAMMKLITDANQAIINAGGAGEVHTLVYS